MRTKTLYRLFIFFLFAIGAGSSIPVEAQNLDSLENGLRIGSIEERLRALSDLTMYYQDRDIPKALSYAWKQKQLAKVEDQITWLGDAYENLGYIYFYDQNIDSTQYYFQAAHKIWNKVGNKRKIAVSLSNLSLAQRLKTQPDSAIIYLQKALTIFEEEKSDVQISQVLANIASMYNDMGNNKKHDEYALKALSLQERLDDKRSLGITLMNLCMSMQNQKRYNEAIDYGERAVKEFREINQPLYISAALIRAGSALFQVNEDSRAIDYMTEAIQIADKMGNIQMRNEALMLRIDYFMRSGNYRKAKSDAETVLAHADTTNRKELVKIYDWLTTTSIYTNDKEDIIKYYKKYVETKDVIQQQRWINNISEMEVKYETEKKELKISALEDEKRFTILLSVAGGAVLLLALAFFIVRQRLAVNRRKLAEQQTALAQQQVKQLEKEQQLAATQAVLDGETSERTRLARDLHDGLGGMLSVVKLNLYDMKKGASITGEDIVHFQTAMSMLDESIRELRRVAHNMMPDSLTRYGLKTALSDFCGSIPGAEFSFFGTEARLDPKLEVMIYRTAHELVNNALKHAEASQIVVQIMQESGRIALTVQDDGRGFDVNAPTKGTGLSNIRNRVASYNGQLNLWSEPGKGTEVNIEISSLTQPPQREGENASPNPSEEGK